jgi:hypothetical protein
MADEGAERVSVADLNVAEKVSITGAEAPEAKMKEKGKPKKAPKEKKPVVHGGGAHGGQQLQLSLFLERILGCCVGFLLRLL